MIAILDYGAGNLRSVENALRVIDAPHDVVQNASGLRRAEKVILPGVGHFGQMMGSLDAMRVRATLLERIGAGVPFLGICLGLQALFELSEEAPGVRGLGILPGGIKRFQGDMRVPHMGWNEIQPRVPAVCSRLLRDLPAKPFVYFAHSYYAPLDAASSAASEYGGVCFTAALERKNVFAIQFHPEKSGAIGQQILRNFAGL